MKNYRVDYEINGEENEFIIEANSPADASDACWYENGDGVDGYNEIQVVEI